MIYSWWIYNKYLQRWPKVKPSIDSSNQSNHSKSKSKAKINPWNHSWKPMTSSKEDKPSAKKN